MHQKLQDFRQKTSVFWMLLASNLIPGIASAVILAVIFLPMMVKTSRSTDDAYEQTMLYSVQTQMEAVQEAADYMTKQIENSEWLHPLYYDLLVNREITHTTNVQIMTDLQLLIAQNNNVAAISFQFYDDPDAIFTDKGRFTNLEFYRENYPDKLQYFFWPCQDSTAQFQTVVFYGETYLLYKTPIRDVPGGRYKGELNLFFRANEIGDRLSNATSGHASSFRILNGAGEILWEHDTGLFREETVSLTASIKAASFMLQMDVPQSIHNRTTRAVLPAMIFTVILDLVLCVLTAIILSKANYRPFQKIVLKVVGSISQKDNEFATLDRVIDRILLEKTETKTVLNELRPLARQKVLRDLLDGSAFLEEPHLRTCQMQFHFFNFNVVALELPFSKRENLGRELATTAELAMETLVEHLTMDLDLIAYSYDQDSDHYRVIINYEAQEDLAEYVRLLFMHCKEFFQTDSIYLGVGQAANAAEEIYRAADQADIAIHYAALNGLEQPVFYNDVLPQMSHEYYYPLSEETLLARAITSCNAESAKTVLCSIIQANQEKAAKNPVSLQRLAQDLVSTVFRSGYDIGISMDSYELERWSPANPKEISDKLGQIIDQICGQFKLRQQEPTNSLESRILAYIDENIFDPALSLSNISEHFGKSVAYVSTVFKTQRGSNYNDYVNKMRIIRAMELMRKDRMDLNSVYPLVGYVSLSTFRRNFIKYAKVNPGDFAADCENWVEERE